MMEKGQSSILLLLLFVAAILILVAVLQGTDQPDLFVMVDADTAFLQPLPDGRALLVVPEGRYELINTRLVDGCYWLAPKQLGKSWGTATYAGPDCNYER